MMNFFVRHHGTHARAAGYGVSSSFDASASSAWPWFEASGGGAGWASGVVLPALRESRRSTLYPSYRRREAAWACARQRRGLTCFSWRVAAGAEASRRSS